MDNEWIKQQLDQIDARLKELEAQIDPENTEAIKKLRKMLMDHYPGAAPNDPPLIYWVIKAANFFRFSSLGIRLAAWIITGISFLLAFSGQIKEFFR